MNDFLYVQRGLSIDKATTVLLIFHFAGTIGQFLGARVGQRLYNRRPSFQPLFVGVSSFTGLSCTIVLFICNWESKVHAEGLLRVHKLVCSR